MPEDVFTPVLIEAAALEALAVELEEDALEAVDGDSSELAVSVAIAYRDAASRIRALYAPPVDAERIRQESCWHDDGE
jgi:hypothetical protein